MIYGKLPVVFLSAVASEKKGSTNSLIASYILDHRQESLSMGIREIAETCHVSLSSVSRFCKDIGLNDFAELKEILAADLSFQHCEGDLSHHINLAIDMAKRSVDKQLIHKLCREIRNHSKVAAFGLLKAETAAINLQSDMLMLGKQIYTNISYSQQMEYIMSADADDLIIIFSYTGSYFDFNYFRGKEKNLKKPQIAMIAGNGCKVPDFADIFIGFDSLQDQLSHPWQLQYIAGLIAQEYSKMKM